MVSDPKTVLVIEDDHDIRVTLRATLENEGYSVFTAANGRGAWDLLKLIPLPTLIICDLAMPIVDGEQFLKMKKEHPLLCNVPTVLISAYKDRLGKFSDLPILKKPLDLKQFIELVNNQVCAS